MSWFNRFHTQHPSSQLPAPRPRWDALRVYLLLSGGYTFCFDLVVTVNLVYHVQTVGLNPLQVVLVGTLLEITCLLLEVPTGVVADTYSRRLSILIGLVLVGIGFIIEGSCAVFGGVLLAQIIWGAGATFLSGATDAWIADEIGEARAAQAYLRAGQVSRLCGLVAIGVSVALASITLALPIVIGGIGFVLLAGLLALVMPETGFTPTPRDPEARAGGLFQTFGAGVRLVRASPVLLLILFISAAAGLFSEGLDRLTTPHLLTSITLPALGGLDPIYWFGLINAGGALIGLGAIEFIRRRIPTDDPARLARSLSRLHGLLIGSVIAFALANHLLLAIVLLWTIGILRAAIHPLMTTWTNSYTPPQVRATVLSMSAQMNAFGQIAGGPLVGAVALGSLRGALTLAGLLLTPALWLLARSQRHIAQAAADGL